ncbi:xanthine dehydrogenase family protein molybdopterin-binding subunit [Sphingomonas faeni]|uniref:xanthine dehydrogenase family protein molybdopterin-binding subunit n=1 Tax=Sphingomonas faeni TaxID=185950 RepID=UPI003346995A
MSAFGIGQAVRRDEDRRFVTGRGSYVDDLRVPHLAYAAVVYSSHAHGLIRSVNVDAARHADSVLDVLTGMDALADGIGGLPPYFMPADMGGPLGYRTIRPILVSERVRCVGDRVAVVVAETLRAARDAAGLIEIEIEALPAVTTPDGAARSGAPLVWDDCASNSCFTLAFGDAVSTDAAFSDAAHIVSLTIRNNRVSANSIEPRAAVGIVNPADGRMTLHTSSQNPHGVRKMLADAVFGIPEADLRVISPDVGGGFGMKADAYPEDAIVLWASRRVGRPVKWVATRSEALMGDNHGRDQVAKASLALDAEGRALGLRVEARHALGAYVASATVAPITYSMRMFPGVYDIPAVHVRNTATFTNCSPTGPYRGAGRPEACFTLERLMDEAADRIGMDRVEIRRRNLIASAAMPYTTATGVTYDSGDFVGMMDRCLELSDWEGFEGRRATTEAAGLVRGRAVTCYVESAGVFNDRMELRFDPQGNVTILAGTHSHGQGHATVFPQLVHEWLGVPYETIRYIQGDTDKVAFGRGTYAARSSMLGGTALHAAAQEAIARGCRMAAHLLEVDEETIGFADGVFSATGTNRSLTFAEVAKAFFRPVGLPGGQSVGFTVTGSAGGEAPNFPNGAHICEVEVDPETGQIHIDRYTVVDDVGRVLNPMICEGQIVGGIAQGLGQALLEQVAYDPESGQLISGSFSDYGMPRAEMMPKHIVSELAEVPCLTNPVGVKGVGESGTIGSPPTLVNAVIDALRPLGVNDLAMPLTPARVWSAIAAANTPSFQKQEAA